MKKTLIIALCIMFISAGTVMAQVSNISFSASDLIPVVSGGPANVANPSAVKVGKNPAISAKGDVVTADSAQDAANAAVKQNKSAGSRNIGCTTIVFPSGMGYVATGAGTYRNMANPTASRLSKRQAYVSAFIMAKKNLAEKLSGLSVDNVNTLKDTLDSVNTSEESAHNLSTLATEDSKQVVDAVLRGFVIFNVEDAVDEQTVYVSIASTPKTLGKLSRLSSAYIEAETLQEGLDEVINEIKSGLVPPIGGKIVHVSSTGETAFVGCGSGVIETDSNKAIQSRLNLSAKRIAAARAKTSLCGMIVANKIQWEGTISSKQEDSVKGFEVTDDPINENRVGNINKLDKVREDFYNRTKTTDVYIDAQKGKLPPGISVQDWTDSDGAWSYSIAIYLPSQTQAATNFKSDIDKAQIIQPTGSGSGATTRTRMNSEVLREGSPVERGPSGQVSAQDKL